MSQSIWKSPTILIFEKIAMLLVESLTWAPPVNRMPLLSWVMVAVLLPCSTTQLFVQVGARSKLGALPAAKPAAGAVASTDATPGRSSNSTGVPSSISQGIGPESSVSTTPTEVPAWSTSGRPVPAWSTRDSGCEDPAFHGNRSPPGVPLPAPMWSRAATNTRTSRPAMA
jgi:hypothetical protein